jgi:uroporphyrinogen decarboxylase
MTSKERVLAALAHRAPDRTPLWHGVPKPEIMQALHARYGTESDEDLLLRIGDDFRWAGTYRWHHPDGLQPFQMPGANPVACETVAQVEALPWPDPRHVDVTGIRERCAAAGGFAVMGGSWAPFFHEIGWLIGQENYFVKMHTHPAVVDALTERFIDFHVAANERVFREAGDLIDFYFFGNDFGTQRGLVISPEMFRRFILPAVRRLVEHARSHGLHVWLHSCGSVRAVIPDLIDAGIEALHPVQVSAAGMAPEELGREFRGRLMFVGGIDVHRLLRLGTPQEVREAVRRNVRCLAPGYVVSPSHEAVLPDVPIENLVAMFDAARGE